MTLLHILLLPKTITFIKKIYERDEKRDVMVDITFGSFVTVERKGFWDTESHTMCSIAYFGKCRPVGKPDIQCIQCKYCRKSMSSLIVCHSKHPLLLTSTLDLIWENQAIISFQVIVQIFYHHGAFILQIAIKGLKCSQNNKLTGKG